MALLSDVMGRVAARTPSFAPGGIRTANARGRNMLVNPGSRGSPFGRMIARPKVRAPLPGRGGMESVFNRPGTMMNAMGAPAAPAPPPPAPAISDFGPGNDLRFSQINPVNNPRVTGAMSDTDVARQKLTNAPSLMESALNRMAELRQKTSEERRAGIQDIGRSAATLGRIGSGVTTSQLGDLESSLQARQLAAEKGLAGDISTQEAADRRANLGATQGAEGQAFSEEQARRDELRGERGYEAGTAQQAFENQLGKSQLQLQGAGQAGNEANAAYGAGSDLASSLAMTQYLNRPTPAGATGAPAPTAPAPGTPDTYGGGPLPIGNRPPSYNPTNPYRVLPNGVRTLGAF